VIEGLSGFCVGCGGVLGGFFFFCFFVWGGCFVFFFFFFFFFVVFFFFGFLVTIGFNRTFITLLVTFSSSFCWDLRIQVILLLFNPV